MAVTLLAAVAALVAGYWTGRSRPYLAADRRVRAAMDRIATAPGALPVARALAVAAAYTALHPTILWRLARGATPHQAVRPPAPNVRWSQ